MLREERMHLLGYYDFLSTPKVIMPWETSNPVPEVTIAHEMTHRDLAGSTSIGAATMVALHVLRRKASLPAGVQHEIEMTTEALMNAQFDIQEGTATFLSCLALYRHDPAAIEALRPLLPESYRAALAPFEATFGRLTTPLSERHAILLPVVYALTKIALSPELFHAATQVTSLGPLRELLTSDSPNRRLQTLRDGDGGRLVPSLLALSDAAWRRELGEDLSTFMKREERDETPLRTSMELLPTIYDEVLAEASAAAQRLGISHIVDVECLVEETANLAGGWRDQLQQAGCAALDDLTIRRRDERPLENDFLTEFVKQDELPLLDNLLHYSFRDVSIEVLESLLQQRPSEQWLLLGHFLPGERSTPSDGRIYMMVWPKGKGRIIDPPLAVRMNLADFSALVRGTPARAFLKIDERMADVIGNIAELAGMHCPVFVLCATRTPEHLVKVIERERMRVPSLNVTAHQIHRSAIVVLVSNRHDQVHWITLIPTHAWLPLRWKLDTFANVRAFDKTSKTSPEELYALLGWDREEIEMLFITTFLVGERATS